MVCKSTVAQNYRSMSELEIKTRRERADLYKEHSTCQTCGRRSQWAGGKVYSRNLGHFPAPGNATMLSSVNYRMETSKGKVRANESAK